MQKIIAPFQPEFVDWLHARVLLRKNKRIHWLYDFGLPVGMAAGASIGFFADRPHTASSAGLAMVLALVTFAAIFYGMRLVNKLTWRRDWKKRPSLNVEIDEYEVNLTFSDARSEGSSKVFWSAIHVFDEDEQILFLLAKGGMLFIPKKSLSTETIFAIRNLARQKIGRLC